jgi:uncharacterized protein (DUF2252 family)
LLSLNNKDFFSMKKSKSPSVRSTLPEQSHGRPLSERFAEGAALRKQCPRSQQGTWQSVKERVNPIDLLIENNAGRVESLVPIRFGRMLANPFAFYRGSAAVMASDLSSTPSSGLRVVACGDCHLMNFGGFASMERRLVFDINDFDEVSIAPWEWDVKRLAASFMVASRQNGFSEKEGRDAAWWAARSYRTRMFRYADTSILDAFYEFIDLKKLVDAGPDEELRRLGRKRIRKATATAAHQSDFLKLTTLAGKTPRIKDDPPLVYHDQDMQSDDAFSEVAHKVVQSYRSNLPPERRLLLDRFRLTDVAVKVVGVGSVGTYCGIALFISGNGDPLFLQFKEARNSVLEPYAGSSPFKTHGERVVFGQRLMQASSDVFLGWAKGVSGRHFYVRQLRDAKVKPLVEVMKPLNMVNYAKACGWALARAHKRSGDAVVLSGYMGKSDAFENAIAAFSVAYADQNERDYEELIKAVRSGRIEARIETA